MAAETREARQARIDRKVADLRARAVAKNAEADRLHGSVNQDPVFWSQPAYSNAAGRAFARQRDRERGRLQKAAALSVEAKELCDRADVMASRGALMAGDAKAEADALVASCEVRVGQMVETTFYGVRRVLKVNAKSVLVEGGLGPLKVEKQYLGEARL